MNSNKNWELKIRSKVSKQLSKFPAKDREHITKTIGTLPFNLYLGDIEKIEGKENSWSRRIGSYRVFYEILPKEERIYVFWVERRTTKTYRN